MGRQSKTDNCLRGLTMEQPLMLQSSCVDCKHYEGFGQCFEHGNNLVENCKDYKED